jgi:hypothetical protein
MPPRYRRRFEQERRRLGDSVDRAEGAGWPKGNWIQTMPGKSWNVILRLYGLLEPWLNLTWRPGGVELAK